MITNPGIYWDDWVLFNQSYEGLTKLFTDSGANGGHPVATSIHYFMLNITNSPSIVYHSVTFVLFFIGIIIFYKILIKIHIEFASRFVITLLFAILPYNIARIYMITFPYSIGFVFMLLGILLFISILDEHKLWKRILSLICLFISFYLLNSTLFYASGSIFLMVLIKYYNNSLALIVNLKQTMIRLLRYSDYIVLPIIYWIIKIICFQPINNYSGYNKFGLIDVLKSPWGLVKTVKASFIDLLFFSLKTTGKLEFLIIFVIIFIFIFFLIREVLSKHNHDDLFNLYYIILKSPLMGNVKILAFLIIGIFLFLTGAFPYVLVGHIPSFNSISSRDQILFGIGTAFIVFDLIRWFIQKNISYKNRFFVFIFFLSVISSLFIVTNIRQNVDSIRAYLFHEAVQFDFKSSDEMKTGRSFIFKNDFRSTFWKDTLVFYTLTGIAKEAFKDETRLIIQDIEEITFRKEILSFKSTSPVVFTEVYKMNDAKFHGTFDYIIFVKEGDLNLSTYNVLKILITKYFSKEIFLKNIDEISTISVEKYNR
jgi:hypothetical protein